MAEERRILRTGLLFRITLSVALSIILSICMLIDVSAANPDYTRGLKYQWNYDGTITVVGIERWVKEEEIVIPRTDQYGRTVTGIANYAFMHSNIKSIVIPDSVISIGTYAFSGCNELTNITVAEGNNVYHSSGNCLIRTATKTLILGCENSVIPTDGSVEYIQNRAFWNCTGLRSITIPKSVKKIGDTAFERCYNLESIKVEEGNETYYSSGNCLIETESKTLIIGCNNSVIPSDGSVRHIANNAFNSCDDLTKITIPEGVETIGNSAFSGCDNLNSIDIAATVTSIGSSAFAYCRSLTSVIIPEGVETIGNAAFTGCRNLTNIELPTGLQGINSSLFSSCDSLTSIVIPESVTYIDSYAFAYCSGLTSVVIPEGVTSIGGKAFDCCINLESVYIPEGVIYIDSAAFRRCRKLKSVNIPSTVQRIGSDVFLQSTEVWERVDGVTYVGNWAIDCDVAVTEVTLRDGTVGIAETTFDKCKNLVSVTLPDTVKYINGFAFRDCISLKKVNIPVGIKIINGQVFKNCSSLASITIPMNINAIEYGIFDNCTALSDVYYLGTESEWNDVPIDACNDALLNATMHFMRTENRITGASLSLGQSLTMNYYVLPSAVGQNVRMRFTLHKNVTIVEGVLNEASGEYIFSLEGITPQCMGHTIKAELVVFEEDGSEIVIAYKAYSIRQYCDDVLAANPENKTLATLLADMLEYGTAAQYYNNHAGRYPSDDKFPVSNSKWHPVPATDLALSDATREDIRFSGAGVRFGYVNRIYYKIKASDLSGVTVTVNGKVYTAEDFVIEEEGDGAYYLYTEGIYATEFDKLFTAVLAVDGEVVQTLDYSVRSYVYAKQNSDNEDLCHLVKTLYKYGRSSIAYREEQ